MAIDGMCDARLRRVRDAFAENFARNGEVGAAVAVTVDGKPVVDLWAGHADAARTRPWTRDTIVNVASTTKGLTAICAHRLVDRGLLDLQAPVATYWPEFAKAGKAAIPVHLLLSHRAGLPAVDAPLPTEALYDWDKMTHALAAQKPWWEPGTQHGYHEFTFGWLVGEVVRRSRGTVLGGAGAKKWPHRWASTAISAWPPSTTPALPSSSRSHRRLRVNRTSRKSS